MPRSATGLKKYLRRDGLIGSKTSDNPHTPPSLRDGTLHPVHSHILRVQSPPADTIPAVPKRQEDVGEISSLVRREHSDHVFVDEPSGPYFANNADKLEDEA
jgi:hypothetical protein